MISRRTLSHWLIILLFAYSCIPDKKDPGINVVNLDNSLAFDWIQLELELVKNTPGFSAPVVARALGYTGITFYESLVYGTDKYGSLEGQLAEFNSLPKPDLVKNYHWGASSNAAMYSICKNIFRNAPLPDLARIDSVYEKYAGIYRSQTKEDIFLRSEEFGFDLAGYIFDWSKTDGGYGAFNNNYPSDYVAPEGEGLWEPTASEKALHPYWGDNRPFLLKNREEVNPGSPTPYNTSPDSQFHREAVEVYEAVNNISDEEIETAFFWTDDPNVTYTPGGHSLHVFYDIIKKDNRSLDFIAFGLAKIGMAVNDAFICCWKSKYYFNYVRPLTYIQEYIDPNWLPVIITPPFPEYTSGHSVQIGAAAEVLTGLFGNNYSFTDHTHDSLELGLSARDFNSFHDFAEEAAISRLYGGIHFRPAIEIGLDQGKQIGQNINNLTYIK